MRSLLLALVDPQRSLLLLAVAVASACTAGPPERTELMRQTPQVVAGASELRLKIRAFANRFAQLVPGAAA